MNDRPKLTRPSEVKAWISARQFLPSKVLGQNFLIDENILRIMIDSAGISTGDRVLEIGPGLGILTEPLLNQAGHVVAIEKDKRLAAHLAEAFSDNANFTLITADALDISMEELKRTHSLNKMVANLPYSVGSRLLVECFKLSAGFDSIVVTVQLEVAERLAAQPNTDSYGLLSIWAQLDYEARVVKRVSPSCFHPRPQVVSAIVLLQRKHHRRVELKNPQKFDSLVKHSFSQRRKQMGTILSSFHVPAGDVLRTSGIEPARRPETVTPEEWIRLSDNLADH